MEGSGGDGHPDPHPDAGDSGGRDRSVHFGIVLLVNVGIGALTPPMGMLVFITSAITGRVRLHRLQGDGPFLIALLNVLAMCHLQTPDHALPAEPAGWATDR